MANNLKKYRESKGYSQQYIAKSADIPQTTFSGWENGTIDNMMRKLLTVSQALGTTIEKLFSDLPLEQEVYNNHDSDLVDSKANKPATQPL